tara:strand:+ start:11 stop:220 length:210 start_codon:yes stop_codon:yes gene_type:complete
MDDFTFNPKILEKINALDQDDVYKGSLAGFVELEKLKQKTGEKEYTRAYDKIFLDLLTDMNLLEEDDEK